MKAKAGPVARWLLAALLVGVQVSASAADPAEPKVLRYAFRVAETGFDPAKITDLYSRNITSHLFEALYAYDHLARPVKIRPLTAAGMPEGSADFKTWTVRIQPGIYFADDPVFKGKKRELTANDYVYAFKRFFDPANKAPYAGSMEELGYLGLNELRKKTLAERIPFDYDLEVPGLRALDRYTIRFELSKPRPRFVEDLAGSDLQGAVAREVVEAYGDNTPAHPVGTGPFVLKQWRRSSLIVLERNPGYRERFYDAEPAADDAEGQALLARFKGRRLPMIDRVEISIVEEPQPRWLSFLNRQHDFLERVPEEFINQALPGGKLAPNLAKQGIQAQRIVGPEGTLTLFNMEDPVVGGYTPEKVALRRAIALAVNIQGEIGLVRRGQAVPSQSPVVPHTTGYDPAFKSEMSEYSPARARALLDLYGYKDRDGDGWRELPDGSPLVLVRGTHPDQFQRQLDEQMRKDMTAVGLKLTAKTAKWPELLKAAQAGKYQIWGVASSSSSLDGQGGLARLYSPFFGGNNLSRFKNAEFDALFARMTEIPNGPERDALFLQGKRIAAAYMPSKYHVHRMYTDMAQAWLIGYRRPLFWNEWWHQVDVDNSLRPAP